MNFLEQLVAEWYAYNDYFVRTNIRFEKRSEGGYKGEFDVIAFCPKTKELIHIEVSNDARSYEERTKMFQKKFDISKKQYQTNFKIDNIEKLEKIIIASYPNPKKMKLDDNVKFTSVSDLMKDIIKKFKGIDARSEAVPEIYPLLRAIQVTVDFIRKDSELQKILIEQNFKEN